MKQLMSSERHSGIKKLVFYGGRAPFIMSEWMEWNGKPRKKTLFFFAGVSGMKWNERSTKQQQLRGKPTTTPIHLSLWRRWMELLAERAKQTTNQSIKKIKLILFSLIELVKLFVERWLSWWIKWVIGRRPICAAQLHFNQFHWFPLCGLCFQLSLQPARQPPLSKVNLSSIKRDERVGWIGM